MTSGWSFPSSRTANSHSLGVGRVRTCIDVLEEAALFLLFPIDFDALAAAIASFMAAAFTSGMDTDTDTDTDMEDTGVSGREIDPDFLTADDETEEDTISSGDTIDGGWAIFPLKFKLLLLREGLPVKITGRVRVRTDLRTKLLLL